jgi:hypothetical protein
MANKEKNEQQVRMTLQDCLSNQEKLRSLLQQLIHENRPLTSQEKQRFFEILPKALLSKGTIEPVHLVIEKGWFTYASVQSMALQMADLTTNRVSLRTTRPETVACIISIGELWRFVYEKVLYLFPLASAEAIHISAESVKRSQQGTYEFSSKETLE